MSALATSGFSSGETSSGVVRDGRLGHAVAAVLEVAEHADGQEAVLARLRRGPSVLVLDNREHLPDAVAEFVERILAASPVTILATSRERLGRSGELVHAVAPLPLGSDAEELFRDRVVRRGEDRTWRSAGQDDPRPNHHPAPRTATQKGQP
ncbi:hypothetical protein [Kibdelosporangium phytohabitans]|uniref:hypothetical protein n=1 Tax=Kibdelosporangium phytohabitans TaxID=860235 RepID=UPI0012FA9D84|nr:hypothetical protein [Kibdelosporangium phytohabitans]MBE1461504.1 hypothetical protein [Kibdelosporangium phytohabitans]